MRKRITAPPALLAAPELGRRVRDRRQMGNQLLNIPRKLSDLPPVWEASLSFSFFCQWYFLSPFQPPGPTGFRSLPPPQDIVDSQLRGYLRLHSLATLLFIPRQLSGGPLGSCLLRPPPDWHHLISPSACPPTSGCQLLALTLWKGRRAWVAAVRPRALGSASAAPAGSSAPTALF